MDTFTWIECPRDAMQGLHTFIPTNVKIQYINALLEVGFSTLDFGSFVSPQAIPQLKDTAEVLDQLNDSSTTLLAIVANQRGASQAIAFERIKFLGFPLSVSESFQFRNTNKSIKDALITVSEIQELCNRHGKTQVVYLSMAFGNPYGDPYSSELISEFVDTLRTMGISVISIADTVGKATPEEVSALFQTIIPAFSDIQFGAHLHARADQSLSKLSSAWIGGCRRFDTAMLGYGGCPMAGDQLVGNIPTEIMLQFLENNNLPITIKLEAFEHVKQLAQSVFHY